MTDEESLVALLPATGKRNRSMAINAAFLNHHHRNGEGTQQHTEQLEPFSHWEIASPPMTTCPHYNNNNNNRISTPIHRRQRSRSLGSAFDNNTHVDDTDNYDYSSSSSSGAPLLDPANAKSLLIACPAANKMPPPPLRSLSSSPKMGTLTTANGRKPLYDKQQSIPSSNGRHFLDNDADAMFSIDDKTTMQPPSQQQLQQATPVWISITYGMINATIVLPVLMSFGSIIYRDQAFQPYINQLIKLTIVSGMVHQLCFSTFSTLPFAVGQVQDAGLIFLSSMAASMVAYLQSHGYGDDDEALLATATIGLGICTALLGCGLMMVGRLKLAQYVQLLPTCVIGGYLAYIGWFCGISGLTIMTGTFKLTPAVLIEHISFILPGLGGGILIYFLVRYLRHMAVLPACIVLLFLCFYLGLWITNTTIQEATEQGWIRQSEPPLSFWHTWDYLKFDRVVWSALPQLIGTELSMIFVVALSSSLDVAAIELELGQPLNYNHELITVGISNVASGMSGGYTGSYIFSQSIFSLRAGIRSPLAGYMLACCQFVILIVPFPVLAYVPNFFYGALLSMIWVDLIHDWLWEVRTRLTLLEYFITWATFGSMQVFAVQWGILLGVGLYAAFYTMGFDVGGSRAPVTIGTTTLSDASLNIAGEQKPLVEDAKPSNAKASTWANGNSNQYGSVS